MAAKKREPMPTAEELLAEAERQRRRVRRARRHAIKRGEDPDIAEAEASAGMPTATSAKSALPIFPPVEGGIAQTPEEMREMFNQAFGRLGGLEALVAWGRQYPKEFYPMWARLCIPKAAEGGGADGGIEDLLAEIDK